MLIESKESSQWCPSELRENASSIVCIILRKDKDDIQVVIFVVLTELPAWKGAFYPHHLDPFSMRPHSHARGAQGVMDSTKKKGHSHVQ